MTPRTLPASSRAAQRRRTREGYRAKRGAARLWPPLAALALTGLAVAAGGVWRRLGRPASAARDGQAAASRLLERAIAERTRELSALATHLQEFAEKERAELAHNLHDELGGLLTAAKMDLSWLQSHLPADNAVQQRLQQLGAALDEAMDVKRRVVENLRPSLLDHFGMQTALRAHVEALCAKSALRCELVLDDAPVPKEIGIALFRIAQEALTNVVRHAGASSVEVVLESYERGYWLQIRDDGRGMNARDAVRPGSHGIAGIRHRVRTLRGRLALISRPGGGTRLEIAIPRPRELVS